MSTDVLPHEQLSNPAYWQGPVQDKDSHELFAHPALNLRHDFGAFADKGTANRIGAVLTDLASGYNRTICERGALLPALEPDSNKILRVVSDFSTVLPRIRLYGLAGIRFYEQADIDAFDEAASAVITEPFFIGYRPEVIVPGPSWHRSRRIARQVFYLQAHTEGWLRGVNASVVRTRNDELYWTSICTAYPRLRVGDIWSSGKATAPEAMLQKVVAADILEIGNIKPHLKNFKPPRKPKASKTKQTEAWLPGGVSVS